MTPRIDLFSGLGTDVLKALQDLQKAVVVPTPIMSNMAEIQRMLEQTRHLYSPMAELSLSSSAILAALRDVQPMLQSLRDACRSMTGLSRPQLGATLDLQLHVLHQSQELVAQLDLKSLSLPYEAVSNSLAALKASLAQVTAPPYLITEAAQLPAAYLPYANRQLNRILHADSDQEAEGFSGTRSRQRYSE